MTKRLFTHDDLSELRSKLMLISKGADGQKLVDRYVKILSLVELVHQNLGYLIDSGCHLFAKWKANIFCSKDRKVSIIVNFGYDAPLIQGGCNLEEELNQLAKFLKVILGFSNSFQIAFRGA